MRVILDLDDDVLRVARSLAEEADRWLGEMISQLARRGLAPRPQDAEDRGLPVFEVAQGSPPITSEMVQEASEDP